MEEKMKILTIVLLSVLLIVSCENPVETSSEVNLYRGQIVQDADAPFLLNKNSLAKVKDGYVVIDEAVASGTVFGSQGNDAVYAARGGEVLPQNTWIANQFATPFQVIIGPNVQITFKELTAVTLLGARNVIYVDENGEKVLFSGDGTIITTTIFTQKSSANTLGKTSAQDAVLITDAEYGIGGDGVEPG